MKLRGTFAILWPILLLGMGSGCLKPDCGEAYSARYEWNDIGEFNDFPQPGKYDDYEVEWPTSERKVARHIEHEDYSYGLNVKKTGENSISFSATKPLTSSETGRLAADMYRVLSLGSSPISEQTELEWSYTCG